MKLFFLCILCLSLVACSSAQQPKQSVIYTSSWELNWKQAMLKRCSVESAMLTLSIYESKLASGYSMSKEQFDRMGRMLNESCLMYYKVVI